MKPTALSRCLGTLTLQEGIGLELVSQSVMLGLCSEGANDPTTRPYISMSNIPNLIPN